jgi:hypothetical protein
MAEVEAAEDPVVDVGKLNSFWMLGIAIDRLLRSK